MNVTKVITMDYAKWTLSFAGQNEPKTNPIRTQTNPIKAKTNPIRTQNEPNFTSVPESIKAARPRISAITSNPYVNEREEKNHSRLPLIEPICPCRRGVCPVQMPVLREKCENIGLFVGNTKKLVLDKWVKWAIIKYRLGRR